MAAAFAGLVTYDRSSDLLVTALAAGVTFVGAAIALVVLEVGLRLLATICRLAVPALLLVLLGCALDWPWAEHAAAALRTTAARALDLGTQGLGWLHAH